MVQQRPQIVHPDIPHESVLPNLPSDPQHHTAALHMDFQQHT